MTSRSILVTAAVAACFQFGCSSHPLREGIWELSFDAQTVAKRDPFPIDKRELKLGVEWDDAGERQIVEFVEIVPNDASDGELGIAANDASDEVLEPMYGDIRIKSDDSAQLTINFGDDHWRWRMFGVIRNAETVVGERFMASARIVEDLIIEGIWMLKWLRDE